MEEHVSPVTVFVNHLLSPLANAVLNALHLKPEDPNLPIPQHVVMALLVLVILTLLALILRMRLSVEKPGAMQQIAELLLTNPMRVGIRDTLDDAAGHHARSFIAFVGSISIFILFSNLMSLFPLFSAPTGEKTVPLACAILTFLYFNYQGVHHLGPVHYLKNFGGGSPPWIAPLIFLVEIISTLARLLSLTVRLYANIFASDAIYGLFLGLLTGISVWGWHKSPVLGVVFGIFPALIPLLFIGLHLLVAVIQTFIFTVLPSVYLGMATAEEH
ncbi:MAG TPA: F0F1 ATP synthase subunit A [Candidatus Dormibacteraeota bacterium]|jgi:F-type H+-transporting ATPase subunit a|nr:F0F1 ATP synthase subunit A [Candidatus Dormibacteraeota bacterium]